MSFEAQYQAARTAAVLVNRSARSRILVSGADARAYLHAMLTNDIAALVPGRGCYAAYLTPQGRMIADLVVLDIGNVLLLDVDAGVKDRLLEKLDQFIFSEDVALGDVTSTIAQTGVHGPQAAGIVAAAVERAGGLLPRGADMAALAEHSNLRGDLGGEPLVIAASRDLAPVGFDVYVGQTAAAALVAEIERAGAVPADPGTVEVLRVERGRPLFGRDMNEETIPLEAGIEARAISFSKGCYPGQEVIVRILHRGHGRVARKLVGLALESREAVPAGSAVKSGERDAGRVTSAVVSPALGHGIALAYVQRELATPGTRLIVGGDGRETPAIVAELPFVGDFVQNNH